MNKHPLFPLRPSLSFAVVALAWSLVAAGAPPPEPLVERSSAETLAKAEKLIQPEIGMLDTFGIPDREDVIVHFLEEGLPAGLDAAGPPGAPPTRSHLIVAAMKIAAVRQYVSASPALERIADGRFSQGLSRLIEFDLRQRPLEEKAKLYKRMAASLRANAVNAMGLMGALENLPYLSRRFEESRPSLLARLLGRDKNTLARVNVAFAIASVGGTESLDYLVRKAGDDDREVSVSAIDALRLITGKPFIVDENTPIVRRKSMARMIREWWREEGDWFVPDPMAIRRRRFEPPPARPDPTYPPRNFQELLVLASVPRAYPDGFNNQKAFRQITAMGGRAVEPLKKIALDNKQDIHVRQMAIQALITIARNPPLGDQKALQLNKDIKSFFRKLRRRARDEPIEEMARYQLRALKEGNRRGRERRRGE